MLGNDNVYQHRHENSRYSTQQPHYFEFSNDFDEAVAMVGEIVHVLYSNLF